MRPSVQEDECGCPELQFVRSVVSEVHVVDDESSFSRAYFYFQICLLFVVVVVVRRRCEDLRKRELRFPLLLATSVGSQIWPLPQLELSDTK